MDLFISVGTNFCGLNKIDTFVGFKIRGHSDFLHNSNRKSLICGYWNSWIWPSMKTTKIGTPRKLNHPQYKLYYWQSNSNVWHTIWMIPSLGWLIEMSFLLVSVGSMKFVAGFWFGITFLSSVSKSKSSSLGKKNQISYTFMTDNNYANSIVHALLTLQNWNSETLSFKSIHTCVT